MASKDRTSMRIDSEYKRTGSVARNITASYCNLDISETLGNKNDNYLSQNNLDISKAKEHQKIVARLKKT